MNLRPRKQEDPEINLISLVDVVLLLVIFFMVSSTFIEEGRIKVRLPEAGVEVLQSQIADPVVITVTERGAYRLNERDLINNDPQTLRAALEKLHGERSKIPVTIRADAQASHQSVVTAMDVVGRLGYAQINIATLSEQSTQ